MQKNENVFVLSGILFIITAVVALLLGFVNQITADKIEQNLQQEQTAARQTVLCEAETFLPIEYSADGDGAVSQIFVGQAQGKTVGYCVSVSTTGFGGAMELMVGVSETWQVEGVAIISHSETPGLGSKAQSPEFCGQFVGKNAEDTLKVVKNEAKHEREIVAISGATITSKAVTKGVNAALAAVLKVKEADVQ